jgi:hypothetical protein
MYHEKYRATKYIRLLHAEVPSNLPFQACVSGVVVNDLTPIIPGNCFGVTTPKCVHRSDVIVSIGCKKIDVKHDEKNLMHSSSSKLGHHVLLYMSIISAAWVGLILISLGDG